MRRFMFAITCGAFVTASLAGVAAGCGSFSGDGTPQTEAGDEITPASDAPAGEDAADAATVDASRSLTTIYAHDFGSSTDAGEAGAAVVPTGMFVEPGGGVALVGTYDYGPVDMGGGAKLPTPTSADAFLLRLDTNGAHVLSKAFGAVDDQFGATLAGSTDKLYASFELSGTMTFTGSDAVTSNATATLFNSTTVRFDHSFASSGLATFLSGRNALVKGTALGAGNSVLSFGDWDGDIAINAGSEIGRTQGMPGLFFVRSFILASGDIVHTEYCNDGTTCIASAFASNPQNGESLGGGRYSGHISGPDGGSGITTAPNDNDAYAMKLDVNLGLQWIRSFPGTGAEELLAATSIQGGFVVAGSFDGMLQIPGVPAVTAKSTDVFVARLDDAGKVLWVKTFGGDGLDRVRAITADAAGNIFLTGRFNGPSLVVQGTTLTNADAPIGLGTYDLFLVWLDGSGNALYSTRFGGGADEDVSGIGVDGSGNVVIAGTFDRTIDFGTGVLTARGRSDMFVAKLHR